MDNLLNFWWIPALVILILLRRYIFQLLGLVIVPEDKIGLVTKKFVLFGDKKELPAGRIIATEGEAGYQAQTLPPGLHFGMWIWQYEITLQPLMIIPSGQIGLIVAKDGAELPKGRVLAQSVPSDSFQDAEMFLKNGGQKGRQAAIITAGTYRINTFLFEIVLTEMTKIGENKVGIITTLDGDPLDAGQIAGHDIKGHNNFQDADVFLKNGGRRGLQQQIVLAGMYTFNPWFVQIEQVDMVLIPIGTVGVVNSYVGPDGTDVSGEDFKHGNIVGKGHKGVWNEPLGPGKYPLNPYIMKVELVPTTNLVLNWATARNESHNLDRHLSTITVRSRDGFPFNLDVSQIIHIPSYEAPKVIARFGTMLNLVSQVLEPTIGNYFRNSAQTADVISFLTQRKERQDSAKKHISEVLEQYNVNGVDTLIGDIVPPESLMKTLTDRKIAEEQKVTYETQRMAQETRQTLEKETAVADMQKQIVQAQQGVQIAERVADAAVKKANGEATSTKVQAEAESQRVKLIANAEAEKLRMMGNAEAERTRATGEAEAAKILAIGKSNAEAYELQVKSIGADGFVKMKVTETIGKEGVKIIPDVLIAGGGTEGGGSVLDLLGLKLLESWGKDKKELPEA
ncbi:MAG: flotillin family protein [Saprospiraceae bacterium]|nr:flotillin family protein [Saprospiraceae bacterium]